MEHNHLRVQSNRPFSYGFPADKEISSEAELAKDIPPRENINTLKGFPFTLKEIPGVRGPYMCTLTDWWSYLDGHKNRDVSCDRSLPVLTVDSYRWVFISVVSPVPTFLCADDRHSSKQGLSFSVNHTSLILHYHCINIHPSFHAFGLQTACNITHHFSVLCFCDFFFFFLFFFFTTQVPWHVSNGFQCPQFNPSVRHKCGNEWGEAIWWWVIRIQ